MKTKITLFLVTLTLMLTATTSAQTNIYANGSFETYPFSEWRMLEIYSGGILKFFDVDALSVTAQDNSLVTDGSFSALVTWGDDSNPADFLDYRFDQTDMPVTENTVYNFNFDAMVDDFSTSSHIILSLYIEWYNSAGGLISFTDGNDDRIIELINGDTWKSVNGGAGEDYTSPAGAAFATVGVKARISDGAGGIVSVATNGTATFIDNMVFKVSATASVEDQALNQAISFYPNPATEFISVESRISLEKVEVFSILGKRVKEVNSNFNAITVSDLASGLYIVKLYSEEGGVAVRKLIKQ